MLEEVILRADGWKKGSSEKEKFQIVWKKREDKRKETYYLHRNPSELLFWVLF